MLRIRLWSRPRDGKDAWSGTAWQGNPSSSRRNSRKKSLHQGRGRTLDSVPVTDQNPERSAERQLPVRCREAGDVYDRATDAAWAHTAVRFSRAEGIRCRLERQARLLDVNRR